MCQKINGELKCWSAKSTVHQETALNMEHVNVVKLWIYELFKSLKNNHKPAEKSVTVTCSSNLGGIIHVKAIKIYSYYIFFLNSVFSSFKTMILFNTVYKCTIYKS